MLGITRLLSETDAAAGKVARGGERAPAESARYASHKRPVVVWNVTRRCNLHCFHCYADSKDRFYPGELLPAEGKMLLEDLASFRVSAVIFSGGDPLLRPDLFELATYARLLGLHTVLSTNGTLIDETTALRIRDAHFDYVGVSLDGIGATHDRFRGMPGAYQAALGGLRRCRDLGMRVGIRFSVSRRNLNDLPAIMDLMESEEIHRGYVSHLVPSGRGSRIVNDDLSHDQSRATVEYLFSRAEEFYRRGLVREVVTGNNDADAVALYLRIQRRDPSRTRRVWQLLSARGGNSTGDGIGNVGPTGEVHPDQFWQHYSFGNVRRRPFSQIWQDTSEPLMGKLKKKAAHVRGRCAGCPYLAICGGNVRVRAEALTGDAWASDPGCYLSDEELGIVPAEEVVHEPDLAVR